MHGWVHTKLFERFKYLELKDTEDYDKTISIPKYLPDDFTWWLNHINHSGKFIRKANYVIEIYSDVSRTSWGAACGSQTYNGFWSADEDKKPINEMELIAAYFA